MTLDLTTDKRDTSANNEGTMSRPVARSYIVDMLEQLMLLAHGASLTHIASGLDDLLEPYRE